MIIRLIITVLVYSFFGWLLCDIDPDKEYSWYSGIWHGLFFVAFFIGFLAFCQCLDSSSVVQVVVPEEIISNKYGGDCHKKI